MTVAVYFGERTSSEQTGLCNKAFSEPFGVFSAKLMITVRTGNNAGTLYDEEVDPDLDQQRS